MHRRAVERMHLMENINSATFQLSSEITQQEHDRLLKEIEPPWSWIHQFATENCRDKSHNFLELRSIASDETPTESSDESFDFENQRFFEDNDGDKTSVSSDNRSVMENMLLLDESRVESRVIEHSAHDIVNASGLIDDIIEMVQKAVANKEIELKNTASIRSFLSRQPKQLKLATVDLCEVRRALDNAIDAKMVFKNFSEFENYLRKVVTLPESAPQLAAPSLHAETISNDALVEIALLPTVPDTSKDHQTLQSVEGDAAPLVKPLESQFDDCQIEIDEKVMNKAVPDEMILGLIGTPPPTPIIIPTPPRTPTPTPPSPHNTSSGIISENVSLHDFPVEPEPLVFLPPPPPPEKQPFQCRVPPMPGIGPAVSKETIRNVVTYLKGRSRNENGLVYPRHLLEGKCPNIVETYEG